MDSRQKQLRQKFTNDLFARLELQRQFSFNLQQAVWNRTMAGDPEPDWLTWLCLYWALSESAIALWLGKAKYLDWGAPEEYWLVSEDNGNECVLAAGPNATYIVDVNSVDEDDG